MTIRTVQGWALALLTVLFFAIAGTIGAPAARADGAFTGSDRLTPRPETQAPIGQLRLVATFDVPEADQGCVATFTVYAVNGDSVHQANYGRITTNGDQADILLTESEPNVDATRLTDRTLTLGDTVTLYNIIGPWTDGDTTRPGYVGTSVDYRVSYTCQDITTTTTSTPTTSSSTTTTEVPPTTGPTTPPSSSPPTTSVPPTTAPTPPSTPPTTIPPVNPPSTLPFTGPTDGLAGWALVAAGLLGLGSFGLAAFRKEGKHERAN